MVKPDIKLVEDWAFYADKTNMAPDTFLQWVREDVFSAQYSPSSLIERLELVRELSTIAPGFASIVLISTSVQYLLHRLGIGEGGGPRIYAVALTEGGSGSDLARSIRTVAEEDSGAYCLKGVKYYTSNGLYADSHLVLAIDSRTGSLELFLSSDREHIHVEPIEIQAFRGAGITKTRYNCAKAQKLTEGRGLKEALAAINLGRLGYAGIGIGIVEGALEDAIHHVTTRKAFGGTLAELQGVQLMIAEIYTLLYPLQVAYKEELLQLSKTGNVEPIRAAALKNAATTAARRAALINLQLHGGRGLQHPSRTLRLFHDALAVGIGEGAYEVLQTFIAKKLLSTGKR